MEVKNAKVELRHLRAALLQECLGCCWLADWGQDSYKIMRGVNGPHSLLI